MKRIPVSIRERPELKGKDLERLLAKTKENEAKLKLKIDSFQMDKTDTRNSTESLKKSLIEMKNIRNNKLKKYSWSDYMKGKKGRSNKIKNIYGYIIHVVQTMSFNAHYKVWFGSDIHIFNNCSWKSFKRNLEE